MFKKLKTTVDGGSPLSATMFLWFKSNDQDLRAGSGLTWVMPNAHEPCVTSEAFVKADSIGEISWKAADFPLYKDTV